MMPHQNSDSGVREKLPVEMELFDEEIQKFSPL
jgi:hypothetical protein